jgi:hypothetical protein
MNNVKTKKELAKTYGVSYPTFIKWLKMVPTLNISNKKRLLTPKDIQMIYDALGKPE